MQHPDSNLELPSTAKEERARLPERGVNTTVPEVWQGVRTPYPSHRSLVDLFEAQAESLPNQTALQLFESATKIPLTRTYSELDRRANQIANYLIGQGISRGTLVGLCLERSLDLPAAVLGILKAGAAYVPLDPDYPAERLKFLLADTAAPLVITQQNLVRSLVGLRARAILLDSNSAIDAMSEERPAHHPDCRPKQDDLAYVMYTSGSTGTPKGVMVEHRNVVRLVRNTNYADFSSQQVFLLLAPISFDASTLELWGSLANGAKLAIYEPGTPTLEGIGEAIRSHGVTTLWLTAGLFHLMVDQRVADLSPLRQLLAGGDILSPAHVQKFLAACPEVTLINGYGPTETTTFAACFGMRQDTQLPADTVGRIPIGRPISNTWIYILAEDGSPVPAGETGELYVGGDGVARGYLNQPERTRERFVQDPFCGPGTPRFLDAFAENSGHPTADPQITPTRVLSSGESRMYRTGDLGRFLPDGNIDFLGRTDRQIKIAGHRIEPGEIESALRTNPAVEDAIVLAHHEGSAKKLVGFVTLRNRGAVRAGLPGELREFLRQILPFWLIPGSLRVVAAFPLTPNGKVDRDALLTGQGLLSGEASAGRHQPSQVVNAGQNEPQQPSSQPAMHASVQEMVARIWARVLGATNVPVDQNFFDLGGDSLNLIEVHAELSRDLKFSGPITDLFQYATVQSFAEYLERHSQAAKPVDPISGLERAKSNLKPQDAQAVDPVATAQQRAALRRQSQESRRNIRPLNTTRVKTLETHDE